MADISVQEDASTYDRSTGDLRLDVAVHGCEAGGWTLELTGTSGLDDGFDCQVEFMMSDSEATHCSWSMLLVFRLDWS